MSTERLVEPLVAPLDADVSVPGSKSIANRAMVCAALADGRSTLIGVPDGDDSAAMRACLTGLGIHSEPVDDSPRGATVVIDGAGGHISSGETALHAALAGTTSRFVTALAALADGPVTIDGGAPLRRRPMHELHQALADLGAEVSAADPGHLPVVVRRHRLRGGQVTMSGDVSSQFVTALMLVAPALEGGVRIELSSQLVSRPYVQITASVMREFGIDGIEIGDRVVSVPQSGYVATTFEIEPDASSASYPLAAAAIAGGRVRVDGIGSDALQGDAHFADLLEAMGCTVTRGINWTEVHRGAGALRGIDVDMSDMSDLVPTLAAVAATASTPTRITGVGFIRHKESDRLGDLAAELRVLGAAVEVEADGLVVHPSTLHAGRVETHHDHRLAMSLSLLGLVTPGVVVADPEVVSKSWPTWWHTLETMRG